MRFLSLAGPALTAGSWQVDIYPKPYTKRTLSTSPFFLNKKFVHKSFFDFSACGKP